MEGTRMDGRIEKLDHRFQVGGTWLAGLEAKVAAISAKMDESFIEIRNLMMHRIKERLIESSSAPPSYSVGQLPSHTEQPLNRPEMTEDGQISRETKEVEVANDMDETEEEKQPLVKEEEDRKRGEDDEEKAAKETTKQKATEGDDLMLNPRQTTAKMQWRNGKRRRNRSQRPLMHRIFPNPSPVLTIDYQNNVNHHKL